MNENNENLKPVAGLQPFRKFCMTIGELPASYLETMTYYEMLVWFTKYLGDTVIPTINNNAECIEELQNKYIEFTDDITTQQENFEESITEQQNNYEEHITGLFNELQTFVNDYFDNLDVQEEIDNKLDDMVEQGTLQAIISEYLNSIAIFGYDNVASMKSSTNLIDGSYARTLGYYSKNDGGSGLYKIRETDVSDTIDEASLILLNSGLVAQLIFDTELKLEQFGCKGDGTTDDTINFNKCLTYARTNHYSVTSSQNKTYLISDNLDFSNINANLNNCEIKTNHAINMITTNTNVFYGSLENVNINCNNVATSGIDIIEGRKHRFNKINILNVKEKGIIYNVGYENTFNNINITAYPNSADSVGIECLTADSHFSNIIFIDCFTGIKSHAENWFNNIHGWISNDSKNLIYHSRLIEWVLGEIHLSQVYADTYHYAIYLNPSDTTKTAGIHANQLSFNQNWSIISTVDLHDETTCLIYQNSENPLKTEDCSLYQVDCPAVLLNNKYTTLSNKKFYGTINFSNRKSLNLDAITFEASNNDNSITYSSNNIINLGDRIEINIVGNIDLSTYSGSKSSISLGTIPDQLIPLIKPINNFIGITSGEYAEDLSMKYLYIGNNGNILTNLNSETGTKWFKLFITYDKRY